jgi:hypothetical protein
VCTLIVLYGFLEDYPVMILHNRYLDRGTLEEPPRVFEEKRKVFAPHDVASKGTWIGFNENSLLVSVTNQETELLEKPVWSRGLLAMDLLDSCSSAEEAKGFLTDPDLHWDYRRGNFLVADPESAWHVVWDRETNIRRLEQGGLRNHDTHAVPVGGVDGEGRKDMGERREEENTRHTDNRRNATRRSRRTRCDAENHKGRPWSRERTRLHLLPPPDVRVPADKL